MLGFQLRTCGLGGIFSYSLKNRDTILYPVIPHGTLKNWIGLILFVGYEINCVIVRIFSKRQLTPAMVITVCQCH